MKMQQSSVVKINPRINFAVIADDAFAAVTDCG